MFRQQDPARLAGNQAGANLFLETLDVQADSRLGEMYPACGFGKATKIAHSCECPQKNSVIQHRPNVPGGLVRRLSQKCGLRYKRERANGHRALRTVPIMTDEVS